MDMISLIQAAFAWVYLMMILEIVFTSTKNITGKQAGLEGRLLFLIYSLFVYYKNFRINIFFYDALVNEPIHMAYSMLNTFMDGFFGLPIAGEPFFFFKYIIPVVFIYHFVEYWFRYGFQDKRISKLISFAAVVLFLSSNGLSQGVGINFIGLIPFGGLFFGNYIIPFLIAAAPTGDETIIEGLVSTFIQNNPDLAVGVEIFLMILLLTIVIFLIYLCGDFVLGVAASSMIKLSQFDDAMSILKVGVLLIGFSVVSIFLLFVSMSFLGGGFSGFASLSSILLSVVGYVGIFIGLTLVAELMIFFAMFTIFSNVRNAFSDEPSEE
ncbi:MAG: hypothetical protein GOV01_00940 [Candidatus Altiarchaeota archaeon]|nr:hypothetical protein [Candidatus Altiarchaeota archaeon]